jgi:hypothetical protein
MPKMPKSIIQDGIDFGFPCSHGTGYIFCPKSCPKKAQQEEEERNSSDEKNI